MSDVQASKIHYIDEGEGDPILFLHGNPMSNYLWRNIIPYLTGQGRCIAPDLIGMGKSDKPDITYGFQDTFDYLDAFIKKLGLKNITLILHDWDSGMGFHYANLNRDNIKAIVFMEAMYDAPTTYDMPASVKTPLKIMRTPGLGWLMVDGSSCKHLYYQDDTRHDFKKNDQRGNGLFRSSLSHNKKQKTIITMAFGCAF